MADERTAWEWRPGGIAIGKDLFLFRPPSADEAHAIAGRAVQAMEVKGILQRARTGFQAGKADYLGAADNLLHLVEEIVTAEQRVAERIGELGGFFAPPVPTSRIPAPDRAVFIVQVLAKTIEDHKRKADEETKRMERED